MFLTFFVLILQCYRYDLIIARTDNQVDMRYMINMDYSNDLPINTLGRRIRTRLYFTSESHLHTLINVLRFQSTEHDSRSCLLSKDGLNVISETQELCYLTQIIIRLFENPTHDFNDPKRFRIEILFSPGATATPLHKAEIDRDFDNSRLGTCALKLISKNYLTCNEVEEYFTESINEGETMDDEEASLATMEENRKEMLRKAQKKMKKSTSDLSLLTLPADTTSNTAEVNTQTQQSSHEKSPLKTQDNSNSDLEMKSRENIDNHSTGKILISRSTLEKTEEGEEDDIEEISDKERVEKMAKRLARRYIIRGVATASLVLGIGCLILARRLQDEFKIHKRYTRR